MQDLAIALKHWQELNSHKNNKNIFTAKMQFKKVQHKEVKRLGGTVLENMVILPGIKEYI